MTTTRAQREATQRLEEAGFTHDQADALTDAVCLLNAGLASKSDSDASEPRLARASKSEFDTTGSRPPDTLAQVFSDSQARMDAILRTSLRQDLYVKIVLLLVICAFVAAKKLGIV